MPAFRFIKMFCSREREREWNRKHDETWNRATRLNSFLPLHLAILESAQTVSTSRLRIHSSRLVSTVAPLYEFLNSKRSPSPPASHSSCLILPLFARIDPDETSILWRASSLSSSGRRERRGERRKKRNSINEEEERWWRKIGRVSAEVFSQCGCTRRADIFPLVDEHEWIVSRGLPPILWRL